ncbi:SICA antigen [Plasmodium coatneyi]|uniref:SICA antigen n=1 Tax=Plasmodium coatneyi TaxID=208452 RepID=A0A1B1DWY5_9APIC|nr:SICA antigen [Plasmodium coatneyi]ANQ07264.1 SICA antigen [Plasmodium coatneyi]
MRELWKNIEQHINHFLGGMTKEDMNSKLFGEAGCNDVQIGDRKMTATEKQWCVFLLQNLWKMKELAKTGKDKEILDAKMKFYIRCSIMNVWFYIYKTINCDAHAIITHASTTMYEMYKAMNGEKECYKCNYGELESMHVNGHNVLDHIFDKIKKGGKPIGFRNKLAWARECKEGKVRKKEQEWFDRGGNVKGGGTGSVEVEDIISTMQKDIEKKEPPKEKKFSTRQYEYFLQLMLKWLQQKKKLGDDVTIRILGI